MNHTILYIGLDVDDTRYHGEKFALYPCPGKIAAIFLLGKGQMARCFSICSQHNEFMGIFLNNPEFQAREGLR